MMTEYETTISFKENTNQWWKGEKSSIDLTGLDEPREVILELTDPDTLEIFSANVIICSDKEKLSEPSILKVFNYESMGGRKGSPMLTLYMQLIERIDDPEVKINIRRDKQRFAQMKGEVLKTLLSQGKNGN